MKRLLVFVTLIVGFLVPSSPASAVPTTTLDCGTVAQDQTVITNLLETSNVTVNGWCLVDWVAPQDNLGAQRKVGIEVPDFRTLTINGAVILNANQRTVGTKLADIITNRNQTDPVGILINGTGVVEGQAKTHGPVDDGTGFDGIQLRNCVYCSVEGVTVRNIRGVNASGATESLGITFDNCRGACAVRSAWVTANEDQQDFTSSGIGVNNGVGVTVANSNATNLGGRGFAAWRTDNLLIDGGTSQDNTNHGYGLEESTDPTIRNVWSVNNGQGGIQIRDTSGARISGVVLRYNDQHALGLRSTGAYPCVDDVVSGEAWAGDLTGVYVRTYNDFGCQADTTALHRN